MAVTAIEVRLFSQMTCTEDANYESTEPMLSTLEVKVKTIYGAGRKYAYGREVHVVGIAYRNKNKVLLPVEEGSLKNKTLAYLIFPLFISLSYIVLLDLIHSRISWNARQHWPCCPSRRMRQADHVASGRPVHLVNKHSLSLNLPGRQHLLRTRTLTVGWPKTRLAFGVNW